MLLFIFTKTNLLAYNRNPKGLNAYMNAHAGQRNASTLQSQNAERFLVKSSPTSFMNAIDTFSFGPIGSPQSIQRSFDFL